MYRYLAGKVCGEKHKLLPLRASQFEPQPYYQAGSRGQKKDSASGAPGAIEPVGRPPCWRTCGHQPGLAACARVCLVLSTRREGLSSVCFAMAAVWGDGDA